MSELNISHYVDNDIPVIRLDGKITIGEGAQALREAIRQYITEDTKKLVIELGGVAYVDSAGIQQMVNTLVAANKMGCKIAYADLSHKLRDLLSMVKLLEIFDVYPSVKEAVQSLREK